MAWREEIAAELAEARVQLVEAVEALGAAEAARALARAQTAGLSDALAPVPNMATAIARRAHAVQQGVRMADHLVAQAKGRVENARVQVEDLLQALEQLDGLIPTPVAEVVET